ncbi:MAG: glycosyltransferase family 2 protein [Heyndrickxia sp.]
MSIIVPVYNVEQYLEKCINSITSQTLNNIEIILVNDGSTDTCGSICDGFEKLDKRIIVIHKNNEGLSSARNAGIKIATGEFISFVDGDDYIDRDMLIKLYTLCKKRNSDIAICQFGSNMNYDIGKQQLEFIVELNHIDSMKELFKGRLYRFSVCNKIFKRSCFEGVLFPEGRIHEDLATTYRLFANSTKAVYTNYKGYMYVKRENSILTSKFSEKRLDAFIGWQEIIEFMNKKYPLLANEYLSCFAYSSIDFMFYILKQVEDKKLVRKYLCTIQRIVKKYYKDLIKISALTIKYKILLSILYFNTTLVYLSYKSKNMSPIKQSLT